MNFKVKPVVKRAPVDPAALSAFADGANVQATGENPWEGKDDKRRIARFQIRLTDYEMEKLKHKAGNGSMHEFCLKAIQNALI